MTFWKYVLQVPGTFLYLFLAKSTPPFTSSHLQATLSRKTFRLDLDGSTGPLKKILKDSLNSQMRAPESCLLCLGAVLQVWQQCYRSQPASAQGFLPILMFRWIPHELYCLKMMHIAKQSYKVIILAIQGLKYGAKEVVTPLTRAISRCL